MALPFADLVERARRHLATEDARERARATVRRLAPGLVFLVALFTRLWFLGEHPLDLYLVSNMAFFDASARHLAAGDFSVVDAFTPVGYPALLLPAYAWSKNPYLVVGFAQAVLGALTASLAHVLALRLTRSAWAALAAGLAVALYLPLVVYGGFLLTETTFAFLVTLFACALPDPAAPPRHGRTVIAGLVLGVATAVRPNLVLAFPLLALHAIRLRRASPRPAGWSTPLRALAFALPVLAVVAVHTTRVAGRPTLTATNGGVNFFLGHCECRAVTFPPGGGVGLVSGYENRKRYTEVIASPHRADDQGYYYRRTLALLAQDPARLVRAIVDVGDGLVLTGLGPWPDQPYYPGWMGHEDALRAFGVWFAWLGIVPAMVYAALRAFRRRRGPPEALRGVVYALLGGMLATLYLFLGIRGCGCRSTR